jgi:tetratricopeptide (TPR) repeat protein
MDAVQEEARAGSDLLMEAMQAVGQRLDTLEDGMAQHHREAQEKIEALESSFGETVAGLREEIEKGLRQGEAFGEQMGEEHAAGMEKMEARMGENRELLADLQVGYAEIRDYYTEQKRFVEADVLRQTQEGAREQNNRGVVYFHRGAYDAAAQAFEKAVELDAEYAEAYNNLGLTYSELSRPEHAEQAFEQAIRLRPDLGEAFNNLGLLYYASLDYEKATEMFSKALEDGCKDPSAAYTNFGNSLYQLERYEEAMSAWTKALQLNPTNSKAKKGLSLLKHQEQGVL